MTNELIKAVESLKAQMEQSIQTSKVLDLMVRRFLTEKEIEEVAKLREIQQENMQRLVDIAAYITSGNSDKLQEDPNLDLIMIEMDASCTIIDNTESSIVSIYEAARQRVLS